MELKIKNSSFEKGIKFMSIQLFLIIFVLSSTIVGTSCVRVIVVKLYLHTFVKLDLMINMLDEGAIL
jgi:hypothetical protein